MSKGGKMSEATKIRLAELARRKRVVVAKITAAQWGVACDFVDDSHPQRDTKREVEFIKMGRDCRAPSYLPAVAVEVLKKRLPHHMVTISAGPHKTRTVPAFYWPTLRLVYQFLGLLQVKRNGQPRLVTREIQPHRRALPWSVVMPE